MPDPISPEAKAQAEVRKLEAETAKLEAEIRDLNRTPWQRPGTWVALGSGLVAIVAGLITIPSGYFSRIKTIAEQQQKISQQAADISKQAVDAAQQKAALNEIESALQQHKLKDQLEAMQAEKAAIEKDRQRSLAEFRVKEAAAAKSLREQNAALAQTKAERANLQRDLALARTRDFLSRLELADGMYRAALRGVNLGARQSTRDELRNTVATIAGEFTIDDPYSAARRQVVAAAADQLSSKPAIAALLLHALDAGGKDSSQRTKFFELAAATAYPPEMAQAEFFDQVPALPFELAMLGPYPVEDKAKLLCTVTTAVERSNISRFLKASRYYALGAVDEAVLDLCSTPFIPGITANRDIAFDAMIGSAEAKSTLSKGNPPEQMFPVSWPKVNGLSQQAASVYLAYLTVRGGRDLTGVVAGRVGGQSLPVMRSPRYILEAGRWNSIAPLPAPFGIQANQLMVAEWPQWLEAHKALAGFWLEPDLGTLRRHPQLLKKAVRGVWIEDGEIPKGSGAAE